MNASHRLRVQFFLILACTFGRALNQSTTVGRGVLSNRSTTDRSTTRDVCELNNSCTTPASANSTVAAKPAEKNEPDKWQYNVPGRDNETAATAVVRSAHETNGSVDGLSFDIDIMKSVDNQSTSSNESKLVPVKYHVEPEENCFCDITKGACDLNCCCDQDCLYVNRNIFQECNSSRTQSDEDSTCIAKVLDSPLFCIVKDNLYSRHFYPQYKISPEIGQVDKLMTNRQLFGWTIVSPRTEKLIKLGDILQEVSKEYEFGSPLLTASESGFGIFRLPKPTLTSRDCNERKPVGFLRNSQTVCTHRLGKDLVGECEGKDSIFNPNVYFKNISFVMNPDLMNDSSKLDCSHNCVEVTPYICNSEDTSTCKARNLTSMTPRLSMGILNVCQGAVTNVLYNFIHNGTAGILAAHVFLLLQNVTLRANALWAVKFTTRYEWVNQTDAYELSGYPGYQSGKPIITGFKVTTTSPRENRTRHTVSMDHRQDRWLTVFATNVDGSCSKTRRRNLHFEYNTFARCSIKVPKVETAEHCEQLQKKIYNVLFGEYVNITNVLISANGVPNIHDTARWIPLASDLNFIADSVNDTCSEIITSVKLIILHSAVGEFEKPEQTVIAAKINSTPFGRSVLNYNQLQITFTVNFYDVTAPPLRVFAEPPTYEIKLPTDFFYPFFSSASRPDVSSSIILLLAFSAIKLTHYLCTV